MDLDAHLVGLLDQVCQWIESAGYVRRLRHDV